MKRLACTALLLVQMAVSCSAQKVTVDPNLRNLNPQSQNAAEGPTTHVVLHNPVPPEARAVNYEALHTRLSTVLGDISRTVRVEIKCGVDGNDWHVRDIPISIYAKDIPLGKLLTAIAHATHTTLGSTQAGAATAFQVYQDEAQTKAIADYEQATSDYNRALASWRWDVTQHLKDIPTSQVKLRGHVTAMDIAALKKVSVLLSAFGPEYKKRALDNEAIVISPENAPKVLKQTLRDVIIASYSAARARSPLGQKAPSVLKQEDVDQLSVKIIPADPDVLTHLSIQSGSRRFPWTMPLAPDELLDPTDPSESKRWADLSRTSGQAPTLPQDGRLTSDLPCDTSSDLPILRQRIGAQGLGKIDGLNQAAIAIAAARNGGFSVVLEDWDYFKLNATPARGILPADAQVSQVLLSLSNYTWRIDSEGDIVVGVAGNWPEHHASLIPASVVDNLRTKLTSPSGADLEDFLPLASFTYMQYAEWVLNSKEIGDVTKHCSFRFANPLWRFYMSLSAEDKAQAQSNDGLHLSKFDHQSVADVLDGYLKRQGYLGSSAQSNSVDVTSSSIAPVLRLRLRVVEQRSAKRLGPQVGARPGSVEAGEHKTFSYTLCVETGEKDTIQVIIASPGPVTATSQGG